ncbi:aspartate/glutamate racemase family protein [Sinorhizobium terangae]|uniref:aspartate/glutamate racemase family protein n=1 Tax=Sinorhizobium terangae TaxID=110322 RepID=UPI0024B107CF|nr:amino acid racemase [Sinorhizobium terangae]WFU49124.1 amino acid racemase [Sinorhizobium terangae]
MLNNNSKQRRIALVGGVSWASSAEYYRRLNIILTDSDEPGLVAVDLNFKHVLEAQELNIFEKEMELVSDGISRAARAGGEIILVCSNTTSRTLNSVAHPDVEVISLIDCVSSHLDELKYTETLLLGTRYTMERDFYRSAMQRQDRKIRIPEGDDRKKIHGIIYDELCRGKILHTSKQWFREMLEFYTAKFTKLDSIILGCTELSLLGMPETVNQCAVIDTIAVHIDTALQVASIA